MQEVGEKLGCGITAARDLITYGISQIPKESAEELVQQARGRYQYLRREISVRMQGAKSEMAQLTAAGLLIRLEEREAKLMGLDAASKVQISSSGGAGALGFDPDTAEPWEVIVLLRKSGEPVPARLAQWLEVHPEASEKIEAALVKLGVMPKAADLVTSGEILADTRAKAANEAREAAKEGGG